MSEAVLRIKAEGGAEVAKLANDVERILAASRRRVGAAARAAQQQESGGYRKSGQDAVREDLLVTRAKLRELALRGDAQKKFIAAYAQAEKDATKILEAEVGKRGELTNRERRQVETLALALVATRDRAAKRVTEIEKREEETRKRNRERIAGAAISGASAVVGAAGGALSGLHGQIQGARQTAAARETALNSTLIQLAPAGASAAEIATLRGSIMAQIRGARLNPDTAIEAIGGAQSFANALGGDTAEERRANVDATLEDVRFASNIDPQSIGGLTRLGALTRKNMSAEDHHTLLRSFAGIGFAGSVETDDAIRAGLPGLQSAWATGTVGLTDPAAISRRRLEIARDFAAQVQAQAASGRTVTVAANRSVTVPQALENTYRQDQLGRAYAARRSGMTDEQKASFDAAFTRGRDGTYTMNESVRSSASNAARFFGIQHNNSVSELRNFLGAHGGGGARQLMLTPDAQALGSYFPMVTNARGQQVHQYDYVDELSRSMITPEQERTIATVRNSEESRKLNADENARDKALLANTAGINQLSNVIAGFIARNPLHATAVPGAAGAAGGAAAWTVGAVGGVSTGTAGAALVAGGAFAANSNAAVTGRDLNGRQLSTGERALRFAGQIPGLQFLGVGLGARDAYRAATDPRVVERLLDMLPGAIATAVQQNPPQTSTNDAVHGDAVGSTRNQGAPP